MEKQKDILFVIGDKNQSHSQISFDDFGVVEEFRAGARECHRTVFHHIAAMSDLQSLASVLLDEEYRQAALI